MFMDYYGSRTLPMLNNLNINDPEGIENVRQYFDNLVTTMNPNSGEPLSAIHPCNRRLMDEDLSTDDADYIQLINTVRLYLYYFRIQKKFILFFFFWYQYLKMLHFCYWNFFWEFFFFFDNFQFYFTIILFQIHIIICINFFKFY